MKKVSRKFQFLLTLIPITGEVSAASSKAFGFYANRRIAAIQPPATLL